MITYNHNITIEQFIFIKTLILFIVHHEWAMTNINYDCSEFYTGNQSSLQFSNSRWKGFYVQLWQRIYRKNCCQPNYLEIFIKRKFEVSVKQKMRKKTCRCNMTKLLLESIDVNEDIVPWLRMKNTQIQTGPTKTPGLHLLRLISLHDKYKNKSHWDECKIPISS